MLSCRIFESIKNEELCADWKFLQTGEEMTAFQQYDWYEMLEKEHCANIFKRTLGKVLYVEVLEDDVPILIMPIYIQTKTLFIKGFGYKKGVYLLGVKGYSDYLNFIYRAYEVRHLECGLREILRVSKQKRFFVNQIQEMTMSKNRIENLPSTFLVSVTGSENCVKLHLPDSFDDYHPMISKNMRSNLKKQKNRHQKDGFSITVEQISGIVEDEKVIKRVAQIHKERFQNKNRGNLSIKMMSLMEGIKKPFDEVTYAMKNNPSSWLVVGKYKGQIISYLFGLKDDRAIRIMQLGFDDAYSKYMPTTITFLKYLEKNIEDIHWFAVDFTRGEERYKYELGGKRHVIYDYCIEIVS